MTRSSVWRIAQLAFTGLLIVILWSAADGPKIVSILAQAQPFWLLVAVAALMCQTVLSAWRWKFTASRLGQTLGLSHATREYFMSQVVNQALPGAVVGDAARAVRARSQAGLAVAAQSVIFERLAGQIAMFVTMALGFGLTFAVQGGLDWPAAFAVPLATTVAIGGLVMIAVMLMQGAPAIMGPKLTRWMRPFYRSVLSRKALPTQIGLGGVITLCNLAAFGFCAWAVGVHLSVGAVFAVVPVVLFSMLIPFTVSGWGVREGAAAVLLPLAGTSAAEGIAASVMFGIAMLLAVLPGLIVMVLK
jgi:uncharacterized membrane protein YbhN (UPF0104 family)